MDGHLEWIHNSQLHLLRQLPSMRDAITFRLRQSRRTIQQFVYFALYLSETHPKRIDSLPWLDNARWIERHGNRDIVVLNRRRAA